MNSAKHLDAFPVSSHDPSNPSFFCFFISNEFYGLTGFSETSQSNPIMAKKGNVGRHLLQYPKSSTFPAARTEKGQSDFFHYLSLSPPHPTPPHPTLHFFFILLTFCSVALRNVCLDRRGLHKYMPFPGVCFGILEPEW